MAQDAHARRTKSTQLEGLSGPKVKALEALLLLGTIAAAAKATNIPERTLRRWATEPAFRSALLSERSRVLDGAVSKLASAAGEAVDTLQEVMRDKTAPATARVSAARVVLESAKESVVDIEVQEELDQIDALKAGRRLRGGAEAQDLQ